MCPLVGAAIMPHAPILIPEVGKGGEKPANTTIKAMEQLAIETSHLNPEMILLLTPHGFINQSFITATTSEYLVGDLAMFGHPEIHIKFTGHQNFMDLLKEETRNSKLPIAFEEAKLDHGALVPLYFLEKHLFDCSLVHLSIGSAESWQAFETGAHLGTLLSEWPQRIYVVASGDLSHRLLEDGPYGFHPSGPVFDKLVIESIQENRLDRIQDVSPKIYKDAGECGRLPLVLLAGIFSHQPYRSDLYSYEGPFGVGYLTASIKTISSKHPLVELAEQAVREWVVEGERITPDEYQRNDKSGSIQSLKKNEKRGVFVTLYKKNNLRGCIGTLEGRTPSLEEEIVTNAILAATEDPRFEPLNKNELNEIVVKVDILDPLEKIDSPKQLDPKSYGIVVESEGRRGVLLPDLEGIETTEQQIRLAKEKAGIPDQVNATIYKFKVQRCQ